MVIPAGTYPGVEYPVTTTSLPVVAYTITDMDDDTAYQLTRAFWQEKAKMTEENGWWKGVSAELLNNVIGKLHPGALRYYEEQGIAVPEALR